MKRRVRQKNKFVRECPVDPHHGEVEDRCGAAAVLVEVVLLCSHVVLDAGVRVDGPGLLEVRPAVAASLCVAARFEKVNK